MSDEERNGPGSRSGSTHTNSDPPLLPPHHQNQYQYGTFQGVAYYTRPPPPPQPVVGFPPPGTTVSPPYAYGYGYHTVPGYAIAEGRPLRETRLPFCGIGIGWFLFIIGFFLAAIPWYVGALILLCGTRDYREKPGLVACMVASILAVIAIVFGATNGGDIW